VEFYLNTNANAVIDWLSHCTLSAISVQWLGVVDKIATFPCFSEVLKNVVKQMDNEIPEKTKRRTFVVS